jgi:hypothetical protein
MTVWLRNSKVNHSPDLKYVIIPEYHKDNAVHFHALISNYNGKMTPTKDRKKRDVFKFSGFRAGLSHAVKIDGNYDALSNYVIKYVTKDMPMLFGKKRFYASRNLVRPIKTINDFRVYTIPNLFRKKVYENNCLEIFESVAF